MVAYVFDNGAGINLSFGDRYSGLTFAAETTYAAAIAAALADYDEQPSQSSTAVHEVTEIRFGSGDDTYYAAADSLVLPGNMSVPNHVNRTITIYVAARAGYNGSGVFNGQNYPLVENKWSPIETIGPTDATSTIDFEIVPRGIAPPNWAPDPALTTPDEIIYTGWSLALYSPVLAMIRFDVAGGFQYTAA